MARTPLRALRIADDLWAAALARAAVRGETVSEVVRAALRRYVDDTSSARPGPLAAAQNLSLAQGMIMQRFACTADEARAHLQRLAESQGRSVNEVAVEVVRDVTSSPDGPDPEAPVPRSRVDRPVADA